MSQVQVATPVTPAGGRPCPVCGRDWGAGAFCQFCEQIHHFPAGVRLATVGRRLGGYLLDGLLMIVTLLVGWLVWSLVVWSRGLTPAKQLLGMRCVSLSNSGRAGWGRMFVRELVAKGVVMWVISVFTLGLAPLILAFMLMWTKNRQELWDKMADTIVVHDPNGALRTQPATLAAPMLALAPVIAGSAASNYVERMAAPSQAEGDEKTCPDCAETIKSAANICRFCGLRFGLATG